MNTDNQNAIANLQAQINALQEQMDALNSKSTIPNNVSGAFRQRLFSDSTQGASKFTITLVADPTGDIVLKEPDGYFELLDGFFVPYYKL